MIQSASREPDLDLFWLEPQVEALRQARALGRFPHALLIQDVPGGGGVQLVEVAGGWQFRTHPDFQQYVTRHIKTKTAKFSQSALETLAIVAYRQPITRVEVEHLRGVDCGGVLKSLLEKRLVKILGKKDIPGRPLIYGTSKEFLEVFGLKDLKSLPTLKEIQALDDIPLYERQEELPLGQDNSIDEEESPSLF